MSVRRDPRSPRWCRYRGWVPREPQSDTRLAVDIEEQPPRRQASAYRPHGCVQQSSLRYAAVSHRVKHGDFCTTVRSWGSRPSARCLTPGHKGAATARHTEYLGFSRHRSACDGVTGLPPALRTQPRQALFERKTRKCCNCSTAPRCACVVKRGLKVWPGVRSTRASRSIGKWIRSRGSGATQLEQRKA